MKRITGKLLLLIPLLLMPACSKLNGQDVTTPDNSGNSGERTPIDNGKDTGGKENQADNGTGTDEKKDEAGSDNRVQNPEMMAYFLPHGSKVHYEGKGNEYAEMDMQIYHPYKDIVMVYENNGGALIRKLYKVEKDKILRLDESPVDTESNAPPLDDIKKMEPTGIYLQLPFEKGASFERWTVTDTDATVETPYRTFEHAVVLEEKDEDFVNRRYFVEEYGEVKRESVMRTKEMEEHVISSSMESVTKPD
ncbi:hypothetical protein NCCP2716_12050 [Sporosarcina sp. NCCP-2716]|uniref:hypothetical protein n=1 Tax=Sporosarcina sp. NCCP-2716 TaxID=2943679 RepID=UPI0020409802|nr:hypothetical protein [Sporosarcina sp. NCCP-2716]GKV68707.1 hypothetical protein NCCP2716_12050 [Sporosarcina sp. NCCP-2716]